MAVTFDGTDDCLVTSTLGNFGGDLDTGFSASLWFKTASSQPMNLLGWYNGPAGAFNTTFFITLNHNFTGNSAVDRIRFFCRDENAANQTSVSCSFDTDDAKWHHLVVIGNFPNDADVEFWVDGVQRSTESGGAYKAPDNAGNATVPMVIGGVNNRGTATPVTAAVSLADIYLTQAKWDANVPPRIYAHGRLPLDLLAMSPIAYWPLMGPTGAAVDTAHWGTRDLSGNGNSVASVASAPVWADDPLPPQAWVDGWFGGAGGVAVGGAIYRPRPQYTYRMGPRMILGGVI